MQREKLDIQLDLNLRLLICAHSKEAVCFEETDAADNGESQWQLQEGREYEYEFVDNDDNPAKAYFRDLPGIIIPRRHRHEGTIKTGIYVGTMPLEVIDDCSGKTIKVKLEIQSVKTSYRDDYRKMLNDITGYYTDLVMQQGAPVTQNFEVDNDAPQQTLYQKFAFVKSIVDSDAFDEAIHQIIQNPVRSWTETRVIRHVENVKRLSRSGIRQIASRNDRVAYRGIKGLSSLPRTLEVDYKCDTTDTSENQFVKYVLTQFYGFCTDIASKKNAGEQLKAEATVVCNTLLRYLGSAFFKDISLPQRLNLNSPVLQRKEGYREMLQGWLIFDLAAKLNWKGGDNVYEAGKKNVAALYEYWIFFKLLEIISSLFHVNAADKKQLVSKDKDQINLELKQGKMRMVSGQSVSDGRLLNVRFYYNRTFGHREDMHKAGSWTMPMRPDYTLSLWPGDISEEEAEREELIVHVHFDAKYRVDKIVLENEDTNLDHIDDENDPINQELNEEKEREESGEYTIGMYKRADILKMHAYKDAIRRTSGAYILYPGTERSNKKGFHEIIPGLGAFCISPGSETDQIASLKLFLLEVKRHMMNRASQREKMALHAYNTYKDLPGSKVLESLPEANRENRDFQPDDINVLLGYFKNEDHLKWILENKMYNVRAGIRKGTVSIDSKMASAKYILLHSDKGDCHFYSLRVGGPKVYGFEELKMMGYPYDAAKENKDWIYLMFALKMWKKGDFDFSQYVWKTDDITCLRGKGKFRPQTITLSELMKCAKKVK